MLTIYKPNGIKKHSIDNSMFSCLTGQELIQQHPECHPGQDGWSFLVYPNMVRYTTGNLKEIKYSSINPGFIYDIGNLKKAWYWMYCESNGYIVIENYVTYSDSFEIIIDSPRIDYMLYNQYK